MSNEKKLTKREKYGMLAEIAEVKANPILAEFVAHELELLAKKNAGKSKVSQAEQEKRDSLANAVVDILENSATAMPNAEIAKAMPTDFGTVSTQKLTPILSKMVENGVLKAEKVKGRVHYSLA